MEKRGGKRSGLKGSGKISRRASSGIGRSTDDKKPISNPNSKRTSRRDAAAEEEKEKKPFKKFEKKPFEKKKFDRGPKIGERKDIDIFNLMLPRRLKHRVRFIFRKFIESDIFF